MIPVHHNYTKSSKLMLIAFAVDAVILVKEFISIFTVDSELAKLSASNSEFAKALMDIDSDQFKSGIMASIIFTSLYYILVSHLIGKGYNWIKYLLVIFILLRINSLIEEVVKFNLLEASVDSVVIVLEVWITILLFKAPKTISVSPDIPSQT